MVNQEMEWEIERKRLLRTIDLAKKQLEEARTDTQRKKEQIIEAKRQLREESPHSIGNLWGSEAFEALAELNQYANPVTDKLVDYEEVLGKMELLKGMIECPYFARIDFRFDGEEDFEEVYIGRNSLKDGKTREMYVYDWRSPIASVFYRFVSGKAFYDAPGGRMDGEVGLKRQYEIKHEQLEYFFDADVQIVDEFLRKLLSLNASSKMKAIVETIQKEQDIVIRDMENDLLMVQGVAGSGKTSIALHRAAYLMYEGLTDRMSANDILIISPNTLFEQYISQVLPELGESNVATVVFEELAAKILKGSQIQSRNRFLENLIISTGYRKIMKDSMEFKTSCLFMEMLDEFVLDIPQTWIRFEDIYFDGRLIASKEILKERVEGRKELPLGIRLGQLEEFVLARVHEEKGSPVLRSEEPLVRAEVQRIVRIDVLELYRKLFRKKKYFYHLAESKGISTPLEEIRRFTEENLETSYLCYDDAIVLTYLQLKIYGSSRYRNVRQVVIDEAQDYYPLQYEIFHLLFEGAKFTVLGDVNQTLEKQENLSMYRQVEKILNKKRSSLVTMDKSFRCTNEILNYSLRFIEQSPKIQSFNRSGDRPKLTVAGNHQEYADLIGKEVKDCLEKGYSSIGLLCKSKKNASALFGYLQKKLGVRLINEESAGDLQGVFLIPVYMSKGLEFDAVIICDADAANYSTQDDKKLLYIACTRALHRLNLFCEGKASPLIE